MKVHLLTLLGFSAAVAARAGTLDVGDRAQLFIDDRFVSEASGVALTMNPPRKEAPVLLGENDWENGTIGGYGTVLDDGGRFRMWYTASAASRPKIRPAATHICYAESADGVHWTKPNLGLVEWEGSRANNIVLDLPAESANVMIDPKAAPAERYKMAAKLRERGPRFPTGTAPGETGIYMYTSPDGLHWTQHPLRVFPFDPDTLNMALYDHRTGRYLAYVRVWNPERRTGLVDTDDLMKSWPYIHGVPPAVPGTIQAPTAELPDVFGRDAGDPPNFDFYTSAVVEYPLADDAYLMFPSAYRHFPEPPLGAHSNDGSLDIGFAVSRDGHKFHRVSRQPYIELGQEGARDSRTEYMYIGMVARGGEIYQYYVGYDYTHGEYVSFDELRGRGAIFRTVQRRDGFVSLDAGESGGHFATPALAFQGRRLVLNQDGSGTGEIRVQIEDASGAALPGFAFSDSDPVFGNDLSSTATWRHGQSDLGSLAGKPVRLAFRMRSAKLYSFRFAP